MRPKIMIVCVLALLVGATYQVIQDVQKDQLVEELGVPSSVVTTLWTTPSTSIAIKADIPYFLEHNEDYCDQQDCSSGTSSSVQEDYSEPFPHGMPPGPLTEQQKHGYCEYYPADSRCIGYNPYGPVTSLPEFD